MLVRIKTIEECLAKGLMGYSNHIDGRVLYISKNGTFIVEDMIKDFGAQVEILKHLETENNYVYRNSGGDWYIPKDFVVFSGWRVGYANKN